MCSGTVRPFTMTRAKLAVPTVSTSRPRRMHGRERSVTDDPPHWGQGRSEGPSYSSNRSFEVRTWKGRSQEFLQKVRSRLTPSVAAYGVLWCGRNLDVGGRNR